MTKEDTLRDVIDRARTAYRARQARGENLFEDPFFVSKYEKDLLSWSLHAEADRLFGMPVIVDPLR